MTIELMSGKSHLKLDSHGAKILELQLNDHLVLGTFVRGDGKSSMTHPCSPIFGPETTTHYGLAQHGPARNSEWEIVNQNETEVTIKCTLVQGSYPEGMEISQLFRLMPEALTIETTHTNNGPKPAPVCFAEHFYWATADGWQDITLNGEKAESYIKNTGMLPLKEENRLAIPGLPIITLTQVGLPNATLWTYKNQETDSYDAEYVCIEPSEAPLKSGFFGSPTSLIAPGHERITELRISI